MSAWEYRSKAEELIAEHRFLDAGELADQLAEAGFILPGDRDTVAQEIAHMTPRTRARTSTRTASAGSGWRTTSTSGPTIWATCWTSGSPKRERRTDESPHGAQHMG